MTQPTTADPKYYFTGKPCLRGHIALRQTSNKGCVTCLRARVNAHRKKHLAKALAREAEYREANLPKRRAHFVEWRKRNSERERAKSRQRYARNPEEHKARNAAWHAANPTANAARCAARHAKKQNAPGRGVTRSQWAGVLEASLGICAYCNERKPLTMDHIEPLGRGGAHDVENIAAVCGTCNPSKNDTPLLVWLARRSGG